MSASKPRTTYVSKGQTLETPPLSVRVSRFFNDAYNFLGLYTTSLFSLDPYASAEQSQFNIHRPSTVSGLRGRSAGMSSLGGGNDGGCSRSSGPGYQVGSACGGGRC